MDAQRCIQPWGGSQIISITDNEALARALADIRDEEAGRADLAARGGGSVREPDERHAEKTEIGVDESDGFIEADSRVRRVELPLGMLGIADGDPRAVDEVDISREAFDVPRFEVERIVRNQECRIGPPLDLDVAPNVVKGAVPGADVVMVAVAS